MARLLRLLVFLLFAAALGLPMWMARPAQGQGGTEAPTGMDTLTNNFVNQATHELDRAEFEQVEGISDGLGPIYNAQSCRECHQNPVTGSISQITELRAGHEDDYGNFVAANDTINHGATTIPHRSP